MSGHLFHVLALTAAVFLQVGADPVVAAQPAGESGEPLADRAAAEGSEPNAALERDLSDELRDSLDKETVRASAALADLERLEAEQLAARQETGAARAGDLERLANLQAALHTTPPHSPRADQIYDLIVAELKVARPALRSALGRSRSASSVLRFAPELDPGSFTIPALAGEVDRLRDLYLKIGAAEARLRSAEREASWADLDAAGERVERLDDLRLSGVQMLSAEKRDEILGLTRAGIDQLRREVEQVDLSARYYARRRSHALQEIPATLRDIFEVGEITYVLARIVLVLALYGFLRRRGPGLLAAARRAVDRRFETIAGARRARVVLSAVQVIVPWLTFLLFLRGMRWGIGEAAEWPELVLLYRLGLLYGAYRLMIDMLVAAMVSAARRYALRLDAEGRGYLFRSVRLAVRTGMAIAVLLSLSASVVGRGALYHVMVICSWIILAATTLRLLVGWRIVVIDAHLKVTSGGALARMVRRGRDRWYGPFVSVASLGWLAGRATATLTRDFALGFEQSRRALSFLFLRRIEKQAEKQGYADARLEDLPAPIVKAFTEEAVSRGPLALDYFPGMDRLQQAIAAWRQNGTAGSFLLIGERGKGKSSWLGRVEADGLPVARLELTRRVRRADDLAGLIGAQLDPPAAGTGGLEALGDALRAGPPRVIIVDAVQNLFLAVVGGYDLFERFSLFVESTARSVFWICAVNAYAWEHLASVRPDLVVFRHREDLPSWSEEQIRDLIRARAAHGGIDMGYEDLIVDRMEGVSEQIRLLQTEEGYTRLLWDYSDGNPRVAMHFWLHSLVPESPTRVRVKLFRAPAVEELEKDGAEGLFFLAAVLFHEGLTPEEAALVTRQPPALCRLALDRHLDRGVLWRHEDRYRVTTHWQRALVRLLKRRNILAS